MARCYGEDFLQPTDPQDKRLVGIVKANPYNYGLVVLDPPHEEPKKDLTANVPRPDLPRR